MEMNSDGTRKTLQQKRDLLMSLEKSIKLQRSHQVGLQVKMHTRQISTE